jgi:hypothetical protein
MARTGCYVASAGRTAQPKAATARSQQQKQGYQKPQPQPTTSSTTSRAIGAVACPHELTQKQCRAILQAVNVEILVYALQQGQLKLGHTQQWWEPVEASIRAASSRTAAVTPTSSDQQHSATTAAPATAPDSTSSSINEPAMAIDSNAASASSPVFSEDSSSTSLDVSRASSMDFEQQLSQNARISTLSSESSESSGLFSLGSEGSLASRRSSVFEVPISVEEQQPPSAPLEAPVQPAASRVNSSTGPINSQPAPSDGLQPASEQDTSVAVTAMPLHWSMARCEFELFLSAHTTAIVAAAPSSSDDSSDRKLGLVSQLFDGFLCWFDG